MRCHALQSILRLPAALSCAALLCLVLSAVCAWAAPEATAAAASSAVPASLQPSAEPSFTSASPSSAQSSSPSSASSSADRIRELLVQQEYRVRTEPHEKVYLHMDKPYYEQGDTMWYSAYAFLAD
ncbi:MAG: hypothetical protein IKI72_05180, partial [Bacteroidales bacterium]|nr:hypothetical protein [Bacteroidales bacterium]